MKTVLKLLVVAVFLVGCSEDEAESKQKTAKENYGAIKKEVVQPEATASKPVEIDRNLFAGQSSLDYYDERCASCHGRYGETEALKASKIINKMSSEKIEEVLKGYRNGTYGGNLKDTMAIYVKELSDEQIKELARLIPTL